MPGSLRLKKLKDVSIATKLYIIVGAMAILIIAELLTLWFANQTLSSVRAFVGAEGLWSKAQKDAVYQLRKYNRTHDAKDFEEYKKFMKVPLGDHQTRMELLKPNPDMQIAREGFLQGRVHPDDIDGMINLFRRFHSNYYISKSIQVWAKGDSIIAHVLPIADSVHAEIQSGNASPEKLSKWMAQVDIINQQLTVLEDEFSYTLGEGCRWLEGLILKILLCVALTVEFTGLFLTFLVTRGISKELNEINSATDKIRKGDLSARAKVYSENEIGKVAAEVNQMTDQLVSKNRELEEVAFIASHDLQQPLMTISNFVSQFQLQYKHQLDANAKEYLEYIKDATTRMQLQINDMLDYSRIGSDRKMMAIDCDKELQYVLDDMSASITECNARVHTGKLPVVNAYFDIKLLFQNLICNAIKFRKKDTEPVINISSKDNGSEWLFTVKDNGIGIEEKHHTRIFTIFQKLHHDSEYTGNGIGLAHCKKIVELHRGKIWVESEAGNGSSFYFTIPKYTG